MLERKKILRQTDTKFTDDNKLLIYEHAKTGEVFIVLDPQLKLTEVEAVQTQVADLLGGGGNQQEEATEPTQGSAETADPEPGTAAPVTDESTS